MTDKDIHSFIETEQDINRNLYTIINQITQIKIVSFSFCLVIITKLGLQPKILMVTILSDPKNMQ